MSEERYRGRPLLKLLESYVLKSLDLLPEGANAALAALEPKLAQIYGIHGTWDEIIAGTMKLPENMPALIREMWERNQRIAEENKTVLTPQQFAEMFVDRNLV